VLPLEGIFGNASGCDYFMTGELNSDDLLLLTPDTLTTYGTGCYFESLTASTHYSYTINALCTAEGEEGSSRETVTVFDRAEDGLMVDLVDVGLFGPIFPCPGTETLFQRGVQT
jgi:hypothetical protein